MDYPLNTSSLEEAVIDLLRTILMSGFGGFGGFGAAAATTTATTSSFGGK